MRLPVLSGMFFATLKTPSAEDLEDYYGEPEVVLASYPDGSQLTAFGSFACAEADKRLREIAEVEDLAQDHDPEGLLCGYIRRCALNRGRILQDYLYLAPASPRLA